MQSKQNKFLLFSLLALCVSHANGCVTQTERVYPSKTRDESVWEELQREFGWQKQKSSCEISQPNEPLYTRVMHRLTTTISEWFSESENRFSEQEIAENRRRFNRKREAALQRLREQQEELNENGMK